MIYLYMYKKTCIYIYIYIGISVVCICKSKCTQSQRNPNQKYKNRSAQRRCPLPIPIRLPGAVERTATLGQGPQKSALTLAWLKPPKPRKHIPWAARFRIPRQTSLASGLDLEASHETTSKAKRLRARMAGCRPDKFLGPVGVLQKTPLQRVHLQICGISGPRLKQTDPQKSPQKQQQGELILVGRSEAQLHGKLTCTDFPRKANLTNMLPLEQIEEASAPFFGRPKATLSGETRLARPSRCATTGKELSGFEPGRFQMDPNMGPRKVLLYPEAPD